MKNINKKKKKYVPTGNITSKKARLHTFYNFFYNKITFIINFMVYTHVHCAILKVWSVNKSETIRIIFFMAKVTRA